MGLDVPVSDTNSIAHRDIKPHTLLVEALADLSDLSTRFLRSERDVPRDYPFWVDTPWNLCGNIQKFENLRLVRSLANFLYDEVTALIRQSIHSEEVRRLLGVECQRGGK